MYSPQDESRPFVVIDRPRYIYGIYCICRIHGEYLHILDLGCMGMNCVFLAGRGDGCFITLTPASSEGEWSDTPNSRTSRLPFTKAYLSGYSSHHLLRRLPREKEDALHV